MNMESMIMSTFKSWKLKVDIQCIECSVVHSPFEACSNDHKPDKCHSSSLLRISGTAYFKQYVVELVWQVHERHKAIIVPYQFLCGFQPADRPTEHLVVKTVTSSEH